MTTARKYKVIHFEKIQINGFVARVIDRNHFEVVNKAVLTSEDSAFYKYMESIETLVLAPANINSSAITNFFIVFHQDNTADLYVGVLPISVKIRTKNAKKKGDMVRLSDIADVTDVHFVNMKTTSKDKIMCVLKVGWKYILYFDLDENLPFDEHEMGIALGAKYKELYFQAFYRVVSSTSKLEKLLKDGWFPFIDMVPDNFKKLSNAYENRNKVKTIQEVIGSYDSNAFKRITDRWWSLPIMKKKQSILMAGINAYLKGGQDNYINCIKNLLSEIEGIVRMTLKQQTGESDGKLYELFRRIVNEEKKISGDNASMLIPDQFYQYINGEIYKRFNFEFNPRLSRHSVTHGAVEAKEYTQARALQIILTIDHLCFMLKSAISNGTAIANSDRTDKVPDKR